VKSKFWIKLYHEILDDPKMGSLEDRLWRRVVELFLLAGDFDEEGRLPALEWMAWRLRRTSEELESDLVEIAKAGIVENRGGFWWVSNFAERQAAESSAERAKRWRRGQHQGQLWGAERHANVNRTFPEQEVEVEVEGEGEGEGEATAPRAVAEAVPVVVGSGMVECPRCHVRVNPLALNDRCEGSHYVRGERPSS
jgi:hypothetical protein